jgi:hypothetical protein
MIPKQLMAYRIEQSRKIDYQAGRAGLFGGGAVRRSWEVKFSNIDRDLRKFASEAVEEIFSAILADGFETSAAYWNGIAAESWTPLALRPLAPTLEMSPRQAEEFATQLLLFLGAAGAKTTRFSQDGGADCISDKYADQVKHLSKAVGVSTVRETFAVGISRSKTPVIFSKSGFTSGALDFAIDYGVLLFTYLPLLKGESSLARHALANGMEKAPPEQDEDSKRREKRQKPSNRSPKSDAAYAKYRQNR